MLVDEAGSPGAGFEPVGDLGDVAPAEPGRSPVEAVLGLLSDELGGMTSWLAGQDDPVPAGRLVMRFGALLQSTPSLRAHQRDMTDRLVRTAAEALAGTSPDDPEPQIAATALVGLWTIQFQSLRRHLGDGSAPARVHAAVCADVRRAADLIDAGLRSIGGLADGAGRAACRER
ncbi:hypothetical protein [Actinacidiphila sp. ITFR-21]|uniref:hypothetical protein n=1 Tax=Actinacidiphila sp. ITFR-21 TaxID=3075199 RepID=UPI00288AB9D0|nr:hypothetical protein [Streptomyces sp. ITFR-21]WNI17226.1 hypothetical protein RLT57_18035 [Streptomyces sp. ITFR-21]